MTSDDSIASERPVTPDGRYFVVRGRLWRRSNPSLGAIEVRRLTHILMDARRAIAKVKRTGEGNLSEARATVNAAKVALGERGPVWWDDGAPDFNRHLARNTPYREWYEALGL